MHQRYGEYVAFLGIYVREAHPIDGASSVANDKVGIRIRQHRTFEERLAAAQACCGALHLGMPLLVDTIDDRVGHAYSGMPDRLYLVNREGKVAYQGGRGPMGFRPAELEQSIILLLLENGNAGRAGR
ncbi:MAG: hypothetical protein L0215_07765 [Gemmataceae bacterium]|nr:hypothetical protein [Gemmataceae bacterium]